VNGAELQVFDARRAGDTDAGSGTPGEVVDVGPDGVTVQADGGRIRIMRVRAAGRGKEAAAEWAQSAGIAAGARLGA
jgi:methionyl-tRNA formyltransferase